tara:strand:+ start:8654 stop:9358 length:705 start_codon:yes stop_codon:yes gene_type:complete
MKKYIYVILVPFYLCASEKLIVGEKLRYSASFKGIKAAEAKLEVVDTVEINKTKTYHVRFTAKSTGITDYIFPIKDVIDIWLSKDSLETIKVESNISEGNFKKKGSLVMYHNDGYLTSNNDTIQFLETIHSPYSLFYYFRDKNLQHYKNKNIYTIQGKKVTELVLLLEKSVKTIVPAGSYMCTKLTPIKSNKKDFKNESKMSILFSDDSNGYPVKIWLHLKYGSLVLELENVVY